MKGHRIAADLLLEQKQVQKEQVQKVWEYERELEQEQEQEQEWEMVEQLGQLGQLEQNVLGGSLVEDAKILCSSALLPFPCS
jgi:flavin-dependent dehydrogenase